MRPGEIIADGPPVMINEGRPRRTLTVRNTGDRPVQVGSHYHFAEANPALSFDRAAARGHRLDVTAGTSVRFEPGIARDVDLVPLAGARVVAGLRGEVGGPLDDAPPTDAPTAGPSDATATPPDAPTAGRPHPDGAR